MSNYLNEIHSVGTDSASWFLFHPDDLTHRQKAPIDWWAYDFAVQREFAAGTLVAVTTGGDGGFTVRLTNQGLTEREKSYSVKFERFRLVVRYNRILLDGGYCLPSECSDPVKKDSDDWITLPNGDYCVTVHALAWCDKIGAVDQDGNATDNALTSYVAVFEAIQDLAEVSILSSVPQLDPSRPEYTFSQNPNSEPYQESWEQDFAILIRPEVFFPGLSQEFPLTQEEYGYVREIDKAAFQHSLLIAARPEPQAMAILFNRSSYGSSFDPLQQTSKFYMSGCSARIVQLTSIRKERGILWATFNPFDPPPLKADPAQVIEIKQCFAGYAASDPGYLVKVRHAHFYAEQVAALTEPIKLGWAIAHALELPNNVQYALLSVSESELIQQLKMLLVNRIDGK